MGLVRISLEKMEKFFTKLNQKVKNLGVSVLGTNSNFQKN